MHKGLLSVVFFLLLTNVNTLAQMVTGHYSPGLFGLKSAHGFPTGISTLGVYHFYYAGEFKDNNGKISTLSKPIRVIASIGAWTWGKQIKKIGAKYNAGIIFMLTNLAPNPETLELDPEKIGLGDIKIIPFALTWDFKQLSISTRYAFWAPTGFYETDFDGNLGKGFWSHNFGLGFTWYIDKAKTWNVNLMNTYEINTKQKGTNITAPSALITEWGIGRTFEGSFNIGVIGYTNQQVGKQSGGNLPQDQKKYRVNGIGMEFSYSTQNKWMFSTRWYMEFLAINRPEGTAIRLIILKNF